jgi:hypothetical protein
VSYDKILGEIKSILLGISSAGRKGKVPVLNQLSTIGGECRDEHFLGLGTGWSEWSASLPCHFSPVERAPSTHCIGVWVASLDEVEN